MKPAFVWLIFAAVVFAQQIPIPVKVVVVTMFERGEDTGDAPGEYQLWVEREHLDQVLPMPGGYRHLRMNRDGVLGMVTGIGTAKAAASVMALGLDPRFDLTKAYWLVAGIGGGDPADVSLGSAVWAEHVIDGDLAYEIDAREIPAGWATGMIPLRKTKPYQLPMKDEFEGEVYTLNQKLVNWAYELTRGVKLEDTAQIQKSRARFQGFPNAQRPPFVAKGDTISSSTFFHGRYMDEWANKWASYYTGGKGNYMISAMEDTGTMQSLTFLSKAGKADLNRVMVLRTVSNYDMQWPGATAAESLETMTFGAYSAYMPALEAAQRVGHVIVAKIVENWAQFSGGPPSTVR
jgi:purine nucleoside permease